jgi:Icc-related predicted phosphoesterase
MALSGAKLRFMDLQCEGVMIIDCISDLHGFYPQLGDGDLLIIAGDLTAKDTEAEYIRFYSWLHKQNYKNYIVVAGNHDVLAQKEDMLLNNLDKTVYLCDSGTEFEGLKIWGSPWTLSFEGENPKCLAFTCETEEELAKKWDCIPEDTDILITHSPTYAILDQVVRMKFPHNMVGSKSLEIKIHNLPNLKYHIFGHIHESYGTYKEMGVEYINCSYVNRQYKPVNKPVRIEL